ncbi:hypothetical protein [Ascidiimonas sp. W6]|uniref:hypothetical protein n=1 Tax=Ascidiimonas meishanensis TaxID=3128903 RepID=UPI0030EC911A
MNREAINKSGKKSQSVTKELLTKEIDKGVSFQFKDKRPETVKQKSIQEIANNHSKVNQFKSLQEVANTSSHTHLVIQQKPMQPNSGKVIQRLREGEQLPSLQDQTAKHLENKTFNRHDNAQGFIKSTEGVSIKSTLTPEQKISFTQDLKKTALYKVVTGQLTPGSLFLHQQIGHNTGFNTVDNEDVRKYQDGEYLPPDLHGHLEATDKAVSSDVTKVSRWADGKTLLSNAREEEEEAGGYHAMGEDGDFDFRANLQKAQQLISTFVSPSVLRTVPAPKVVVHKQMGRGDSFRAYQGGTEIHIASNDTPEVIVHEVGHYLEGNLDSSLFFDAAALREKRHAEAIGRSLFGRRAAGRISDQEGETNDEGRGRYKGDYPATGGYTAKVYEGLGATEVVSRTLEYLSEAGKAQELIENDPQQAMIILRRIRPDDPQIQAIAQKFKDYLPNK